jgi:hypothetical protein
VSKQSKLTVFDDLDRDSYRVEYLDCALDETCSMCTGETCSLCGAGTWRHPYSDGIPCDHDVEDRHTVIRKIMIPKSWWTKQLTFEEFKNLKRIDVMNLPLGYSKENLVDKDKSVWWHEPAFKGIPGYDAFLIDYEPGDQIWRYSMPGTFGAATLSSAFTGPGMHGFVLVRGDEVVSHFITGA